MVFPIASHLGQTALGRLPWGTMRVPKMARTTKIAKNTQRNPEESPGKNICSQAGNLGPGSPRLSVKCTCFSTCFNLFAGFAENLARRFAASRALGLLASEVVEPEEDVEDNDKSADAPCEPSSSSAAGNECAKSADSLSASGNDAILSTSNEKVKSADLS